MGYTTEFWGEVEISPPLNASEVAYINRFGDTRRMNRHSGPYTVEDSLPTDPARGGWESPHDAECGQRHTTDVIDYNNPPPGQPGLWCQWTVDDDGTSIQWDGAEKFYSATDWMEYLIEHFLKPDAISSTVGDPQFTNFTYDHVLNGTIEAQGEDPDDRWRLVVRDNKVKDIRAKFVFEDED